ncbi:MAG: glutamine--fructose-6-phosphate transaminase (isomerizing) [Deltaproteobacteria bacterium]|nr:glutamine--fructose-6-phosphate transaminase (isomerizing) [Deltaproteobacteria bacterium]MBI3388868.1 glutamine--fructose-6-phosphate transaminase (isomerizing) [Deltaproteobacteria bacterium]
MCGIVGYVGKQDATPILIAGLHRLEYRGYDSAGVAVIGRSGLKVHKAAGKIRQLEDTLPKRVKGTVGIGHTRWATHGEPNDVNAHPHSDCTGQIAVVHNGIIENAAELRTQLEAKGHVFHSDTDTEVLAHLIEAMGDGDLHRAVCQALAAIEGTYGIAVVDARHPDRIVTARNGSPVVIGLGEHEMFVASDVAALVRHTQQVVYLDDREVATVDADGYHTSTLDDRPTQKSPATVQWGYEAYDRGPHAHFLLKEIMEQPEACERTLKGRLDTQFQTARLGGLNLTARDLLDIRRIKILGCGSAYYAGIGGAHLIERLARVPADAEAASEFRYRNPVIENDTLYIAVSQSGETADTLAAVREVQRKGGRVLGVVNAVGSTIARECDGGIYIHAGPEISVASTKTFVCTLVAFSLLALHLGRIRDLSPSDGKRLVDALHRLPEQLREILRDSDRIKSIALKYAQRKNMFFIGRASGYPVALEGAQKLKEISYIHAEAYPASELKHGPLALISPETPTVIVLPRDELYEKSLSSLEEIRARRGPLIAVTHPGDEGLPTKVDDLLVVPSTETALNPILLTIPLQLFAYHCAVALGRDIDQPRNLAKSVTVE